MEEAKRCRAELERLRAQEVRVEEQSSPEEPGSEVNALRRQLLGAYDELKAAEDRDFKTQHKLKWFVCRTHIIIINTQTTSVFTQFIYFQISSQDLNVLAVSTFFERPWVKACSSG